MTDDAKYIRRAIDLARQARDRGNHPFGALLAAEGQVILEDVGLSLKGLPVKGRLEASGSFNSMCTHRVRIESAPEIDAELLSWLRQAYEQA